MIKNIAKKTAAAALWIIVWQIAAMMVANELLLPLPLSVVKRLAELCIQSIFWQSVLLSLFRIITGILCAVVLGTLLGFCSAMSKTVSLVFLPIMSVVKSTPVASFIMLALLWIDRNALPAFISALIVLPVVVSNVETGIRSTDKKLLDVAYVYKFTLFKKIKYIYFPTAYPYFLSACRSSLGLAWKAGIAAEVLAVPVLSIGKMIYESKLYLETVDLFAWTAATVIMSVIIDCVFEKIVSLKEGRVRSSADNR